MKFRRWTGLNKYGKKPTPKRQVYGSALAFKNHANNEITRMVKDILARYPKAVKQRVSENALSIWDIPSENPNAKCLFQGPVPLDLLKELKL